MSHTETSEPTLKDLMSYVGCLLLKWGQIEHSMRSIVGASQGLTATSRQGKGLVEAWREIAVAEAADNIHSRSEIARAAAELEAQRPLRNRVCHGIRGASSDPLAGRPPQLFCCLEGVETVVSWDDLDEAIRRLEGVAHIIR